MQPAEVEGVRMIKDCRLMASGVESVEDGHSWWVC